MQYKMTNVKILAIETSCDETAIAVVEAEGSFENTSITVLGNSLYSQASKHAEYGGVFPSLAKREHQINLAPLTAQALTEAGLFKAGTDTPIDRGTWNIKESEFADEVERFLKAVEKPAIDLIVVTKGPGLEPALWTGITFAEALGKTWGIPVIGVDHMEGHIVSGLLHTTDSKTYSLKNPELPLLGLLISGGHTELVKMDNWFSYSLVGKTKDDAVGEAFDKVARLLNLPYPGGPKVAESAKRSRDQKTEGEKNPIVFPRPLINENTCDFSFSGLKTAVLYKMKSMPEITDKEKDFIAEAFEDAARDVIVSKTKKALELVGAKTLAIGGGVSANTEIREALGKLITEEFPDVAFALPHSSLTGDNAVMIAGAGYLRTLKGKTADTTLTAQGNLRLE